MAKLERAMREISKYDYIRFALCDLNGVSRGPVVPARNVEKYLTAGVEVFQGMTMFGSDTEVLSIPNENAFNNGNMALFPVLDSLRPVPWADYDDVKVAEFLCESRWKKNDCPQEACPRYAARKQIQKLEEHGLELFSGFEMEYFMYHADTMEPLFDGKYYMGHKCQNKNRKILFDTDKLLFDAGIELEKLHAEYCPGQFEAIMKPTFGINTADAAFNLKQGVQEIADSRGFKATFLSKPSSTENGAGAHFSFSVLNKETGENVFYDANAPDKLSSFAKHWIAGIMNHNRAITVLCSPTTNCYSRLHRPWAPSGIFWNIEDRDASLRVKNHGPSGTYMENRIPSGKSNPYLVMAATVAAGMDGVINKLECPEPGSLKESVSKGHTLPKTLPEAVKALEEDKDFVKAIGEELVTCFLCVRENDVKKFEKLSDTESLSLERKLFM